MRWGPLIAFLALVVISVAYIGKSFVGLSLTSSQAQHEAVAIKEPLWEFGVVYSTSSAELVTVTSITKKDAVIPAVRPEVGDYQVAILNASRSVLYQQAFDSGQESIIVPWFFDGAFYQLLDAHGTVLHSEPLARIPYEE